MRITPAEKLRTIDEVLEAILFHTANHLAPNVTLQGGAALHFIYSSPRYSTDIDLLCPDIEKHTAQLDETYLQKQVLVEGQVFTGRLAKAEGIFRRYSFATGTPNMPAPKVEVYGIQPLEWKTAQGKFAPLDVETPQDIYADKIVATVNRLERTGGIKPTDLFDLNYIADVLHAKAVKEHVEAKAEQYGMKITTTDLERTATHIADTKNHPEFSRHIRKSLQPDLHDHVKLDGEFYTKAAQAFR